MTPWELVRLSWEWTVSYAEGTENLNWFGKLIVFGINLRAICRMHSKDELGGPMHAYPGIIETIQECDRLFGIERPY